MKIVNIIQRYPPAVGGAETWCQQVSQYLARRGHQVRVLTLDVNKEEEFWREPTPDQHTLALGPLAFDEGVMVRRYRRSLPNHTIHHQLYGKILDKRLNVYFYGPHSSEMYGRMWRELKWADVVFLHTQPYPHNYIAFVLAKWLRKRIVIVPHFHPSHPHYERASNYWLLKHSDIVVTVTEYEKDYLIGKGIPERKIVVTGNAIHPQEYTPQDLGAFRERMARQYGLAPDDLVVTFIGRKTPEKGVEHLVRAARALLSELPLKLFLVGPTFDWFEKLYGGLTEEEKTRIVDLGVLSDQDKVNLLHLSHLLALPSRYEAFGIVFLEAWICGVPVLGTRGGAVPSVIGEEGYLCDFGDVPALTETLRRALSEPARLRALGEKGRTKVLQNYTWETIGRKAERAVRMAHVPKSGAKLKIVVATNSYPPRFMGGAELIAHAQAKLLSQRGHQVTIFAGELDDDGERHSARLDSYDGLPIVRVCLHRRDYSSDFFGFYHERVHREFEALLDRVSPDIVHFHNINGLSVSLVEAARRRKIQTVLTLHDYWGICLRNTLLKGPDEVCHNHTRCHECMPTISGERWADVPLRFRQDYLALELGLVDTFVSPSASLADKYIQAGFDRQRMHVIANGIDVDRFARIQKHLAPGLVRFTFVGYLGHHKGLDTVFDAIRYLADEKLDFLVNLVGEGERRNHYEEQLKSQGLSDRCRFWGKVEPDQIERVYEETDVLLLPSIWPENQPVSITEAMAAGIPVIASRLGGIPELVDDGRTGYLFEAGNARDLASKMMGFITDSSASARLGANARSAISALAMEHQLEKVVQLYEQERPAPELNRPQNLILCAGKVMSAECAAALDKFSKASPVRWRFCLQDWLGEDWIKQAHLLWVVDPAATRADVSRALRNHIPLLVPEENRELRDLCVRGKCGLYYANGEEAVGWLRFLTEENETREILAQNSFRVFYKDAVRMGGVV